MNKSPWLFTLINKSAEVMFFMNLISFISFFLISFQGISESGAETFLITVSIISVISVVIQFFSIIFSVVKREKVLKKSRRITTGVIKIILTIGILILCQMILVLSMGMGSIW